METDEIQVCKTRVVEFANLLNEWQVRAYLVNRIVNGQFVSDNKKALLSGYNWDRIIEERTKLFQDYTCLEKSKWGTTPGSPVSFPNVGDFHDINIENMEVGPGAKGESCEIIAKWKYRSAELVKFTLKYIDEKWRIVRLSEWDPEGGKWIRALL